MFNAVSDSLVSEEEFLEYYTNVSASVDDDMYFSQMMNSAWNLSAGASPYQVYEKAWATAQADTSVPVSRP